MKPQHYVGGSVTEQPDGSGILEVKTARGQLLLIHFAPHVYADLGFLFYQKYSRTSGSAPKVKGKL